MSDAKIIEAMVESRRKGIDAYRKARDDELPHYLRTGEHGHILFMVGDEEAGMQAALTSALATGLLVRVGDAEGEWRPIESAADWPPFVSALVYVPVEGIDVSYKNDQGFWCGVGEDQPTHWQPLPTAPIASTPKPGEKT